MPNQIRTFAANAANRDPLTRAHTIVRYTHESADSLLKAFETVRRARNARQGAPTDEEQDLLRAMLVMTGAGLDSALKQIIRDALPTILNTDEDAKKELVTFVARKLPSDASADNKFLARVLAAKSQQTQVIDEYVYELTGQSLQSAQELMKATKALGINPTAVGIDDRVLTPIFKIRNKIIHELDINFDHPVRNRQTRSRRDMCDHANKLLEVAEKLLLQVATKV